MVHLIAVYYILEVSIVTGQDHGAVELQTFLLGTWFALLAFAVFTVLGSFSSLFARWLEGHPRAIFGLNMGAGMTFIAAGLSVLLLGRAERS